MASDKSRKTRKEQPFDAAQAFLVGYSESHLFFNTGTFKMTRQYFAPLEPRPDDPILGLVELYKNDPRETKVNLGVGV